MMNIKKVSLLVLSLLFFSVSLIGCGGGGGGSNKKATVRGYVKDYDYQAISDVKVEIGNATATRTDANGYFITPKFPAGTYTVTFSKQGYVIKSFKIAFTPGDWQFNDSISLNIGIGGGIGNGERSGIQDVPLINGDGEITINNDHENGKFRSIVAIPYNYSDFSSSADIKLYLDGGISFNCSLDSNPDRISSKKTPNFKGIRVDPAGKIRILERKMLKEFAAKGIRPGISNNFHAQAEPPATDTFLKVYGWDDKYPFTATQVYSSGNCAIYLDNKASISSSYIKQLGDAFNQFYANEITYFGPVANNIDGTEKIYIVLTDLDEGVGGYFWGVNEYSNSFLASEGRAEAGCSNEKEILFIATGGYKSDPSGWFSWAKTTMAHEFQHLINFTNRMNFINNIEMETWVNEGLSQVAQDIAMTGTTNRHDPELEPLVMDFLNDPGYNSLCDWSNFEIDPADYPPAYLFIRYFADRFGADKLKTIITTDQTAMTSIENLSGLTFHQLFRDWMTAIVLDYLNYGYSNTYTLNNILYQSWNFGDTKFNNRLGILPRFESVYLESTTGGFLYRTNLESVNEIKITVDSHFEDEFGLRILLLPAPGVNFSFKTDTPPSLIRVK